MSTTPDTGLPLVAAQQAQPEVTHNEAVTVLASLFNGVIDQGRNTAPVSPTVGDAYIIGAVPTGTWAGRPYSVAVYTSGGWRYFPDRDSAGSIITMGVRHEGVRVWDRALNDTYVWTGAAWQAFGSASAGGFVTGPASSVDQRVAIFSGTSGKVLADSGLTLAGTNTGDETTTTAGALINGATSKAAPVDADHVGLMDSAAANVLKKLSWSNIKATLKAYFDTLYAPVNPKSVLAIACSDETTALTSGTGKATFINPFSTAFNVTAVVASLTTAQTSGLIFTVDINEAGVSILSTKLTIDNAETNSSTAATAAVISDASIAAYAAISIDIDQVGDGTAKGLKVYLVGYPS